MRHNTESSFAWETDVVHKADRSECVSRYTWCNGRKVSACASYPLAIDGAVSSQRSYLNAVMLLTNIGSLFWIVPIRRAFGIGLLSMSHGSTI